MVRPRLDRRFVALLVYALAVNAVVWASARVPAVLLAHQLCGATTSVSDPLEARTTHVCCDLACAAQGTLPAPGTASPLAHRDFKVVAHVAEPARLAGLFATHPRARGPPSVL